MRCGIFLGMFALATACLISFFLPVKFDVPQPGAILVTGAGSGIGRHTALQLAKDLPQHMVFGMVRTKKDSEELHRDSAGSVNPIIADLTSRDSLQLGIDVLREKLKKLDTSLVAFFDSAGKPIPNTPVEFLDVDALKKIYDVDVFGLVSVLQLVLPMLRQSRGRICLMGSFTGLITPALMGADPARAIEAVADAMRREVRDAGVAVSVIQAGFIRSPVINKTEALDHNLKESILGEAMRKEYPKLAGKSYETQVPQSQMPGMDTVSEVVLHAFTSSRPRLRYIVGVVPSPVPTKLLAPLMHILPHEIIDLFE